MIRAFFKLKLRSRILVSVAALAALAMILTFMFNLLNGTYMLFTLFPDSVLLDRGDIQKYNYTTFNRLDKQIQFPNTSYGVSIGGEELYTTGTGTCFKYTEMIALAACMVDGLPTSDYVESAFPVLLTGEPIASAKEYDVKKHDTGYLNTFETEYEAGILKTDSDKYYVMTYRLSYDGHDFLMAAATDKKTSIKEAFIELNHMFYTFCRFEDEVQYSSMNKVEDSGAETDESELYVSRAPTIELFWEDERFDSLDDAATARKRDEYKLKYPDAESIESLLRVGDEYADAKAAFSFEYTYSSETPSKAELKSPSGNTFEPDYFNSDRDGRITFVVDKPEKGTWEMSVADDAELGEYSVHVMDYDDYMEVITPSLDSVRGNDTEADEDFVSVSHSADGASVSVNMVDAYGR